MYNKGSPHTGPCCGASGISPAALKGVSVEGLADSLLQYLPADINTLNDISEESSILLHS